MNICYSKNEKITENMVSTQVNYDIEKKTEHNKNETIKSLSNAINNIMNNVMQENIAIIRTIIVAINRISVLSSETKDIIVSGNNLTNESTVVIKQKHVDSSLNNINNNIYSSIIENIGGSIRKLVDNRSSTSINELVDNMESKLNSEHDIAKEDIIKTVTQFVTNNIMPPETDKDCDWLGNCTTTTTKNELEIKLRDTFSLDESFTVHSDTKMENTITNTIKQSNIARCINNVTASNLFKLYDINKQSITIQNSNLNTKIDAVVSCLINQTNINNISNTIVSNIEKTINRIAQKSTNKPLIHTLGGAMIDTINEISVKPSVKPSVTPSVKPSVKPSVDIQNSTIIKNIINNPIYIYIAFGILFIIFLIIVKKIIK
jgi:hypothetical protein